ncbi:MAG: sugar kinase [Janthinobacterium lividum]
MPKIEYAIIVRAKTRLEQLKARYNTAAQAKFVVERSGGNFSDYEAEQNRLDQAVSQVQRELSQVVKSKVVEREFLPSFIFADDQVVVVVGQDGLVANAAKYVRGRPLVAVNPDPARYDGVLLPFRPDTCRAAVHTLVRGGEVPLRTQPLAQATLQDGQRLLAFNDLFIGAASHVSARYRLTFGEATEEQSSSGILVATPAGSTGWLSSVFNMARGLEAFTRQPQLPAMPTPAPGELLFVVREPFLSQRTQAGLVAGRLAAGRPLQVESLMPAGGVIFSDGVESDFLRFISGSVATVGPSGEVARLVQAG